MATIGGVSLPLLLVIVGVVLSIAEAAAPGAHLIVLGVALIAAGLIGLVVPVLGGPLALAALVLAAGGLALLAYRELDIYGGKGVARTRDSDSLRGRSGRVVERVSVDGGRVKLHDGGFDPTYTARSIGDEIPVGAEVIVVDPGGGNVLTVESLDALDGDDIDRELARERDADVEPE